MEKTIKKYPSQDINLEEFYSSDWFKGLNTEEQMAWKVYPPNKMYFVKIGESEELDFLGEPVTQVVSCVITDLVDVSISKGDPECPIYTFKVFKRGENPPDTMGEIEVSCLELIPGHEGCELMDKIFEDEEEKD